MPVCPLCHHTQAQGAECEECGKLLAVGKRAEIPILPLDELESARFDAEPAPPVQVAPMPDQERHQVGPTPDVAAGGMEELERHVMLPFDPMFLETIEGIDRGREQDDGVRTVLSSAQVFCRYCKTPATTGVMCERCGMRLPRRAGVGPPAPAPAESKASTTGEAAWTRCRTCGAPAKGGLKCGDCGRDVPMPEA